MKHRAKKSKKPHFAHVEMMGKAPDFGLPARQAHPPCPRTRARSFSSSVTQPLAGWRHLTPGFAGWDRAPEHQVHPWLWCCRAVPAAAGEDAGAAGEDAGAAASSHPLWLQKCLGISRLMRTKEINWWVRPNETAVQINSPHQQKQTGSLNESRPASLCGVINRGSGGTICAPLPGTGSGREPGSGGKKPTPDLNKA